MRVALDDLSRFLATPPPRPLPDAIRRAALPRNRVVFAVAVAILVWAVTIPLAARVFPERLFDDLRLDLADAAIAEGTIESIADTGMFRVTGADDRRPIRRIGFRFAPASGRRTDATCYTDDTTLVVGESRLVEYLPATPGLARLRGSRLSHTPRMAAAVILLPLAPLVWLIAVRQRRRRVRALLRDGRFTLATIDGVPDHTTDAPLSAERHVALSFPQADGELAAVRHLPRPNERAVLAARRASRRPVGIVHDPRVPGRLMVTDTLLAESTPSIVPEEPHAGVDEGA